MGPRGAKLTAGRSGIRRTVGLPGTGLWHTEKLGGGASRRLGRRRGRAQGTSASHPPMPNDGKGVGERLSLGFFQKLFTPQAEKDFVEGMKAYHDGKVSLARQALAKVSHLADGAFVAATLALRQEDWPEAEALLQKALRKKKNLSKYLGKYGLTIQVLLPITERIFADCGPDERSVRLMLAEIHQRMGKTDRAAKDLRRLFELDPTDATALLALVEILVLDKGSKAALQEVVERTAGVENESEIEAALLLWKGKALAGLGLNDAARDTLTKAYRRKKDRSAKLLQAIRYERALIYEKLGQKSRARKEFESLYAEDPSHEDVAARLGL